MPSKKAPNSKKAAAKKSVERRARAQKASAAKPTKKAVRAKARARPAAKGVAAGRFSKKPSNTGAVADSGGGRAGGGVYSVHPGVQMMVKWAGELKGKTGRTLEEWVDLLTKKGPRSFSDRVAFLKSEHEMGTNAAWWIAERAEGKGAEDLDPALYLKAAEKYVDEQYAGKKAGLRPVYERLLSACLGASEGAKACPCKTMVPIYVTHVVAQLKASTNSRIDLGLALGDTRASGRLIDTGGYAKKDRITHRIEITSEKDIDGFVRGWIKTAFARSG